MCSTFVYLLFSLEAPGVTPAQDAMPRGGGEKTLLKILRWMREPYTCFDPHCEHPKKSQKQKKNSSSKQPMQAYICQHLSETKHLSGTLAC